MSFLSRSSLTSCSSQGEGSDKALIEKWIIPKVPRSFIYKSTNWLLPDNRIKTIEFTIPIEKEHELILILTSEIIKSAQTSKFEFIHIGLV